MVSEAEAGPASKTRKTRRPVLLHNDMDYSGPSGATIRSLTDGSPEVKYSTTYNWPAHQIIDYLQKNAFSIPGRSQEPLIEILSADGQTTTLLPQKYRIPLMWVAQFLWTSVQINLPPQAELSDWEEWKYGILHVSILCSTFLLYAREQHQLGRLFKDWRCSIFDRPLVRYYNGYLLSQQKEIDAFNREHGEQWYGPAKDILGENWRKFAVKGQHGFKLTEEQILNGMEAKDFYRGLRLVDNEPPSWPVEAMSVDLPPSPSPAPAPAPASASAPDSVPTYQQGIPRKSRDASPPAPPASAMDVDGTALAQQVASTSNSHLEGERKTDPKYQSTVRDIEANGSPTSPGQFTRVPGATTVSNTTPLETNGVEWHEDMTEGNLASILRVIMSSGPLDATIPKAVTAVLDVLREERRRNDARLENLLTAQQREAEARIYQVVGESKVREEELRRTLLADADAREERLVKEIRLMGQGR